jgi:hypothetical protein
MIAESTWMPLLLGTRDPDSEAAALAFDAMSAKQGAHLTRAQWKMAVYSLKIAHEITAGHGPVTTDTPKVCQYTGQYTKLFSWVSLCPLLSLRTGRLPALVRPNKEGRKAREKGRFRPFDDFSIQAEGTGLEPATPLLGHHISSVAANHSLTLRKRLSYNSLRYALLVVKCLFASCAQGARKDGCIWIGRLDRSIGLQTP